MADNLDTVKEIIVALLIAEKGTMTISQLEREYRSSEGGSLPYKEFGCANVHQFLNKISDSVSTQRGFNGEELVSAKVSRDVQHINRMVQQQKQSTPKRKVKQTRVYTSLQRGWSSRGQSSRGRSTGRGRSSYYLGTRQPPMTHIAPQQPIAPPSPSASCALPKGGGSSSRLPLLPSPTALPTSGSSASNGKGPYFKGMDKLRDYFMDSASVSRKAATGSSASVDTKYSARDALPDSLTRPNTQHEPLQEVHESVPQAHQTWQPVPKTSPQEQPNSDSACKSPVSLPVSAKKPQFDGPHNSIVDRWKAESNSVSLPAYHGTSFSGAFTPMHSQPIVRPSLLSYPLMMQPAEKSAVCASDSSAEQTIYSTLNPSAATYEPAPWKLDQSSTTEHRRDIKEDVSCKVFASKQTQAVAALELKDKGTSTVDLVVPDCFSDCVKTLLEEHAHGLEIGVLFRMCRDRMGNSAYFMCDRFPLEMVRDVLASVPSVCVVSDCEGKCTVKLLQRSQSEGSPTAATLPDDLSDGLMSVLLDYPQGLDVSELQSLYERRFGRHDYISAHGQCTADFVRNVVIALPHTSLTSHGSGIYTVKLYRENTPEHQVLHFVKPARNSSADESDSSEEISAYSVQEVPRSRPFSAVLGEVFSPSEFYILFAENHMIFVLESLMTELDKFYSTTPAGFYAVDRKSAKPGFVCAAQYPINGKPAWHRAVVKNVRANTVYVSYIDYGTVMPVKVQDIRRLRPDFLELPAQAIKASLAGVKPSGSDSWLPEANELFLQLARAKSGQCTCSVVGVEEDTLIVKLKQSSGSYEYSFGDVLITEGLAVSTEENGSESFVHTLALSGSYTADVITWNAVHYMSGVGISKFFGEERDIVSERLEEKRITFPGAVVDKECYPDLHNEICYCEGFLSSDSIRLYTLCSVSDILRVLEHPSTSLILELEKVSMSAPVPSLPVLVSPNGTDDDCRSKDSEDSVAFREYLQTKLETLKKERAALRWSVYTKPDSSMESELEFVEKQVASIEKLLDMNSASQAEEAEEASKSSDSDFKSRESSASNSSQSVVKTLQLKLLEALKSK